MKSKWAAVVHSYPLALAITLFGSIGLVAAESGSPVQMIEPEDGTRFNPHANVTLRADADTSLRLQRMEFVQNGRVLAVVSNAPYVYVWTNAPTGTHALMARAIPESGAPIESPKIRVRIYLALLTFGLDRIAVLERNKLFGIPIWQYVASLIYIFLAFYVSKTLDFLTRVWLKRHAEKTESKFDDLLLDLLNGPIKIVAFVIFLRVGLAVFAWPALVQNILARGFTVIVAVTITYMALKFIDLILGYWKQRARPDSDRAFDEQLFPIIRKSLKVFVIVVATLVTLDNIGVNITAAIASLSIGGLAIGLAAQDTLANLFGAVAVFADKPFRIGDVIKVDDITGTVESIGMRSTRVRNPDGYLITIPNKTMGNATIINITQRPNIKTEMNIGLASDTSADKVKRALGILEEVYRANPMTEDLTISFNKFAESSLNIQVVHWWKGTDLKPYLAGMQELNLAVKQRFDAEGIHIALPSRTIHVKQDSDGPPAQKASGAARSN